MSMVTESFLDDVQKAIEGMWNMGIVPSIQRLEVALKDRHFADGYTIREATKKLLDQDRIKSLPLDQPETADQK